MGRADRRTYRCSFCGKSNDQVQRLIAGPRGIYICDECVDLCHEIVEGDSLGHVPVPTMPMTRMRISLPSDVVAALHGIVGPESTVMDRDRWIGSVLRSYQPIASWLEQHGQECQTTE
jgi:hypothetical protein